MRRPPSTVSRLSPAGRRPLRPTGAVLGARAADPLVGLRAFAVAHDVDEETVALWERYADLAGLVGPAREAFLVAGVVVEGAARAGSSVVPVGEGFSALVRRVLAEGLVADEARLRAGLTALAASIDELPAERRLIGRRAEQRPLVLEDGALALHHLASAEVAVADAIRALLAAPPPCAPDAAALASALDDVVARLPPRPDASAGALAPAQLDAVVRAWSSSFLIVSGGPGTGKTSVVTTIVRTAAALGVPLDDIALAAPTGRAAKRMMESLQAALGALPDPLPSDRALGTGLMPARTIHRLLGARRGTGRFRVNASSPLVGRLLVVDEASMISLPLMAALLDAVPRDRPFTLVLTGDADQLPSVETGDVLRALTRGGGGTGRAMRARVDEVAARATVPAVRALASARADVVEDDALAARTVWLTEIFRQASDPGGQAIARAARAIHDTPDDATPVLDVTARASPAALAFRGVEHLDWTTEPEGLASLLARYHAEFLDESEALLGALDEGGLAREDPRVGALVAARSRARLLCLTHDGPAGERTVNAALVRLLDATLPPHALRFAGAPILVEENDDATGLANGDQGVVLPIRDDDGRARLRAVFPMGRDVVVHALGRLPRARLAFAMTVHKSQGSEMDHAVIVLPPDDGRLLVRETLYTALTRAKRGVVVAGPLEVWRRGLARRATRDSMLRERLRGT